MDEEFDSRFGFDIVGGLNLEEVRGVVNEEPYPVLDGPLMMQSKISLMASGSTRQCNCAVLRVSETLWQSLSSLV